ncbi:Rhs protein, partial [Pseudomonas syringae pv. spinaceae]
HVKDNRLKQWRNHEYKYDAWGNLIEKAVGIVRWQTFTYDCENRLVKTETMADTQMESTNPPTPLPSPPTQPTSPPFVSPPPTSHRYAPDVC